MGTPQYILGIETSCDETAAAIVQLDGTVLSNVVSTQVPVHARYGGVVPELASRNHLMAMIPVIDAALDAAKLSLEQVDAIAVTQGPGLIGSLLVGLQTAKTLAMTLKVPLLGVDHVEAHITAAMLAPPESPDHEDPTGSTNWIAGGRPKQQAQQVQPVPSKAQILGGLCGPADPSRGPKKIMIA